MSPHPLASPVLLQKNLLYSQHPFHRVSVPPPFACSRTKLCLQKFPLSAEPLSSAHSHDIIFHVLKKKNLFCPTPPLKLLPLALGCSNPPRRSWIYLLYHFQFLNFHSLLTQPVQAFTPTHSSATVLVKVSRDFPFLLNPMFNLQLYLQFYLIYYWEHVTQQSPPLPGNISSPGTQDTTLLTLFFLPHRFSCLTWPSWIFHIPPTIHSVGLTISVNGDLLSSCSDQKSRSPIWFFSLSQTLLMTNSKPVGSLFKTDLDSYLILPVSLLRFWVQATTYLKGIHNLLTVFSASPLVPFVLLPAVKVILLSLINMLSLCSKMSNRKKKNVQQIPVSELNSASSYRISPLPILILYTLLAHSASVTAACLLFLKKDRRPEPFQGFPLSFVSLLNSLPILCSRSC